MTTTATDGTARRGDTVMVRRGKHKEIFCYVLKDTPRMHHVLPLTKNLEERNGEIFVISKKNCKLCYHHTDPDYAHITLHLNYEEMLNYDLLCKRRLNGWQSSSASSSSSQTEDSNHVLFEGPLLVPMTQTQTLEFPLEYCEQPSQDSTSVVHDQIISDSTMFRFYDQPSQETLTGQHGNKAYTMADCEQTIPTQTSTPPSQPTNDDEIATKESGSEKKPPFMMPDSERPNPTQTPTSSAVCDSGLALGTYTSAYIVTDEKKET